MLERAKALADRLTGSEPTLAHLARTLREIQGDLAGVEAKERSSCHEVWLHKALQSAVTLEFATIPPYLCALWSVRDELHPVAKSIREIVQEEMLHMALAANMLSAIGGQPQVLDAVPSYPGALPMGVHPGLVVQLSGLTRDALSTFMRIERPERPLEHEGHESEADAAPDRTIGEFYDCIGVAFHELAPDLSTDHQIAGPLAWSVIRNLRDVDAAIDLIKRQGEGSEASPEDRGVGDLAHYYRFEEILEGRKLEWDEKRHKFVHGAPIPWPEVHPVAPIPKGGYLQSDVSPEVWNLLERFDVLYTQLLGFLQGMWGRGGQANLVRAIDKMFELEPVAKALMRIEIPGRAGEHYGPCFRRVEVTA